MEGKVELQGVKSVSKLRKQCTNGKEWRTCITETVQNQRAGKAVNMAGAKMVIVFDFDRTLY